MSSEKIPLDKEKIKQLLLAGRSVYSISKEYNKSPATIWRIKKDLGLVKPKDLNQTNNKALTMSENVIERRPEVMLALQERKIEELENSIRERDRILQELQKSQQELLNQLKEITKKPLQMEESGNALHVSCPNCGTTGTYQLKTMAPKTFDDVLSYFDSPHEGGVDAFHCKNCRPKIEAKLKEHGLELKEVKK